MNTIIESISCWLNEANMNVKGFKFQGQKCDLLIKNVDKDRMPESFKTLNDNYKYLLKEIDKQAKKHKLDPKKFVLTDLEINMDKKKYCYYSLTYKYTKLKNIGIIAEGYSDDMPNWEVLVMENPEKK